jgi:DNA-binding response OmpR family regulator
MTDHARNQPPLLTANTDKTILVLEKDTYLASLLHYLLQREGFQIRVITDPGAAILHIENAAPADLIFMNEEWLRHKALHLLPILRNYPGWNAVPIISLMQHYRQNEIDRELHEGITDYLLQPFEPADLLDQIQKYTVH